MSEPLPYFAPLLPWQTKAWEQVTRQFDDNKLPHGLLASGMAGIGKRHFVWRLVAWLLCHDRQHDKAKTGACGSCDSCRWLSAGTHPDLMVLPDTSLPTDESEPDKKKSAILIDEIRALQEYSHLKGQGVRLIVLDGAETLTLGAGNALLKTLEEPRAGVHLLLISDNPTKLLPTIKSRVQTLPLHHIEHEMAHTYVADKLGDERLARLALNLTDGAVLKAVDVPNSSWFHQRALWLKTWLALRHAQRSPVVASDYWQGVLDFESFVVLTRLMLMDVVRVGLGIDSLHDDVDVVGMVEQAGDLSLDKLEGFLFTLDEMTQVRGQNVSDKMAYDALFAKLAVL